MNTRRPIQVVLKATTSGMRRPIPYAFIHKNLQRTATECRIRIYEFANTGDHLHLLIRVPSRSAWKRFIRKLTGHVALFMRRFLKIEKGQRYWKPIRPFTRILANWRRSFRVAKNHIAIQHLQFELGLNKRDMRELIRTIQLRHAPEPYALSSS